MVDISYDYADYHRTVIGYHGTTTAAADRLVAGEPFAGSHQDDEWLGHGVYFWEYAPKQAWWWARKFKKHKQPAVVGAVIRLGNCLDLLHPPNVAMFKAVGEEMVEGLRQNNETVPRNYRQHKNLDCAAFNWFYHLANQAQTSIDSARAVYVPTAAAKRIWTRSWIYDEAHIQICVRNPKSILAVWHVQPNGGYGKETQQAQEKGQAAR